MINDHWSTKIDNGMMNKIDDKRSSSDECRVVYEE